MTFAMKMRDMQNLGYSEGYEDARKNIAFSLYNDGMEVNQIAKIVKEIPATVQSWIDSQEQKNN